MTTPIDQIAQPELNPTLRAWAKHGGTTEDADWMRSGENAALVTAFIHERRGILTAPSFYRGEFWNERAKGSYWTYPEGWAEIIGPAVLDCRRESFPGLDFSAVDDLVAKRFRTGPGDSLVLPQGLTAVAVWPKLEAVAAKLCGQSPHIKSWKPEHLAVQYILGVMKEHFSDGFKDWTDGNVGPQHSRLFAATAQALATDAANTPGDAHVVAVQTGALFAGYSVRAARGHLSCMPQEGMHDFGGLCLMDAHPERFRDGALILDCPGTERAPHGGGVFNCAPYLRCCEGQRWFGSCWVHQPYAECGSGSFLSSRSEAFPA